MSENENAKVMPGLEGVIAMETRLSRVDGLAGELIIAGSFAEDLATTHSFEEVFWLLWHGALPDERERIALEQALASSRARAFELLKGDGATAFADPMDALRAMVSQLASGEVLYEDAIAVLGAIPVANALWLAKQRGVEATAPSPEFGHARDYLRMLLGKDPGEARARALSTYLITVSDHGMNASTFAARVIASTQSDLVAALVGAIGALKGPLHGGAPGPVLDMLDAIGAPANAEAWLRAELEAGRRVMGMGHRVYRVRDPRAAIFERALATLASDPQAQSDASEHDRARLELARAIETTATQVLAERYPDRDLRANVEFYTAVLLEALQIPRELFTATFAVGRAMGWAAHVREQRIEGRLLRPRALYTGDLPKGA